MQRKQLLAEKAKLEKAVAITEHLQDTEKKSLPSMPHR
jgi:hypothetical protein